LTKHHLYMNKLMLLGDEAIAQAAIDSGISGIYGYPGTPSTEIIEYVQASDEAKRKSIRNEWSVNEKTAYEESLGMVYAGKRAMVCMKHVGLNVAADPFINSAITGVNGGLVVVAADDPSMHSSQNEQDSRFFGKFSMVPVLEPSSQQEAYDMTRYAFDLSERFNLPVLIRITTRLAHSRSGIIKKNSRAQNKLGLPSDLKQFVLLPAFARMRYKELLKKQNDLNLESDHSVFNEYLDGKDKSIGIIACGLAYNYYKENKVKYNLDYPVVKISQYPVPLKLVKKIADEVKEILILEEGFYMVEELLRGLLGSPYSIHGRMDGTMPRDGELDPNIVAHGLSLAQSDFYKVPEIVVKRPPALCKGCGHSDMFNALNEAMKAYGKGRVFSDIGCYTLGALPPFDTINSCVDMGASITMAKGAADAGLVPSVAVIGDSTFIHSGITGLLDAVIENSPITVIISDNKTTGMTGGQKSVASDKIDKICMGVGVYSEHLLIIEPLKKNHGKNVSIIKKELEYKGVSVIISRRECIQTALRSKKHGVS